MKIKANKAAVSDVDMTPMIDIVFQLIAFFMVITNFEQTQADERVKLPRDELAKPPEVKRADEMVINIGYLRDETGERIEQDPYIFYNGELIPPLQFGPQLKQEARLFQQKGIDPKSVTVVLRADGEVPTGIVQELIRLSQENGFEKFAMKAVQKAT